jgi:hypothetical protein
MPQIRGGMQHGMASSCLICAVPEHGRRCARPSPLGGRHIIATYHMQLILAHVRKRHQHAKGSRAPRAAGKGGTRSFEHSSSGLSRLFSSSVGSQCRDKCRSTACEYCAYYIPMRNACAPCASVNAWCSCPRNTYMCSPYVGDMHMYAYDILTPYIRNIYLPPSVHVHVSDLSSRLISPDALKTHRIRILHHCHALALALAPPPSTFRFSIPN